MIIEGKHYRVDENGCWIWLMCLHKDGYATIHRKGKTTLGHIFTYVEKYGPVPEGLELDHTCEVRRCINPDHVEPVTHHENLLRSRLSTKFSDEEIAEVRRLRKEGMSTKELALKFNMNRYYVYDICNANPKRVKR